MLSQHFHHVGCAVRGLDKSVRNYSALIGERRRSRAFDVQSQGVRVCFVELHHDAYLEFVEPTAPESPLEKYLRAGFYHMCFLVEDMAAMRDRLGRGFRALPAFASEAFGGRECQFVVTPEGHLVEFAEMSRDQFAAHFEAAIDQTNS